MQIEYKIYPAVVSIFFLVSDLYLNIISQLSGEFDGQLKKWIKM